MKNPILFDNIRHLVSVALRSEAEGIRHISKLIVNRDLLGRVRLFLPSDTTDIGKNAVKRVAESLVTTLGAHGYPLEADMIIETPSLLPAQSEPFVALDGLANVFLADRVVEGGGWGQMPGKDIAGPPRLVFFSLKGGVGRSTALAAAAWHLAREGRRVMVLDLDIESPGLSSTLLDTDRMPSFGSVDWLVEDLVGQGECVLEDMVGRSTLATNLPGDILVVPAHGRDPGEYISKLGRAFMGARVETQGESAKIVTWSERLAKMVDALVLSRKPDVILLDSRAGIGDAASAVVTSLGGHVLLFAVDSEQTWAGYRILFNHWRLSGVADRIREKLQVVGALIPETQKTEYTDRLRENAWILFLDTLYDTVVPNTDAAGTEGDEHEPFSYALTDDPAPHNPIPIDWHRGFFAIRNHLSLDPVTTEAVYGRFLKAISQTLLGG